MLKMLVMINNCVVTVIFFSGFFDEKKAQRNRIHFKKGNFSNIINVFVTFEQMNVSLRNMSIN